jgi:DNA-binding transcriptional MerR regulator
MFKTRKLQADLPSSGTFTSSDVARVARVSLRQLQWWDERRVVSPRHDGHKRIYQSQEVLEIIVIAELRRKGFSLQKIRRVLRFLDREVGRKLSDILTGASDVHLLTDGRSVYLEDRNERVIDILKNARQPMFLVCLSDQARRLGSAPKKPVRAEIAATARKARAV